jgi:hypothetical protein
MATPKSWSITDKGSRAEVIEAVNAAAFITPKWKSAIAEQIELHNPRANLLKLTLRVDVFSTPHGEVQNIAGTITEL